MRNFVAKHDYNRAAVHKSAKSYNRKWSMDWDEVCEPPKAPLMEGSL